MSNCYDMVDHGTFRGACNCAAMEFVNAKLKELEAALDERHKQVMAQIQENLEAKKSQ